MALHWNVSACAEEATSEQGWTLTNALIWATMFIGISRITDKNVDEFYARLATYEELFRPLLWKHDEKTDAPIDCPTTYEELKARIGLSTNASTFTRSKFIKNLGGMIDRDIESKLRKVRAEKEAA